MHDLLIPSAIALTAGALFFLLYHGNERRRERAWLLQQLKKPDLDASERERIGARLQAVMQVRDAGASWRMTALVLLLSGPASLWLFSVLQQSPPPASAQSAADAPDLETAMRRLQQRLAENPDDLEGQTLLARSLVSLQRHAQAVTAYRKALQLAPQSDVLMTELAEALAYAAGSRQLPDESMQWLQSALQINPDNQKALWLLGMGHLSHERLEQANALWTRLLPLVQDARARDALLQQLNSLRGELGLPALQAGDDAPVAGGIRVRVRATDAVRAQLNGGVLFIAARRADGPPMPLAARRIEPRQWPVELTLNERDVIQPGATLEASGELLISAKYSKSGTATPSSGDIISRVKRYNSETSQLIELILDQVVE